MAEFETNTFSSNLHSNPDPMDSQDNEFIFDLHWLQETFYRHWKKALLIFLVVCPGIFLSFLIEPPEYEAQVKLKVEVKRPVFNLEKFLNFEYISQEFFLAQPNLIQSRRLARNVINQMHLWEIDEFNEVLSEQQLESFYANGQSSTVSEATASSELESGKGYSKLVNQYLKQLSVSMERTAPQILYLRFSSSDPELAAKITNTHAEEYIEFSRKSNAMFTDDYIDGLNLQLQQLDRSIRAKDEEILNFKKENGFFQIQGVSSYDPIQDIDDRLSRVRSQLGKSSSELTLAISSFEVCFLPGEVGNYAAINPDALHSSKLDQFKVDLISLQKEFADIKERYLSRHPKYIQLSSQIEVLVNAIDEEVLSLVEKRRIDFEQAQSTKRTLLEEEQELIR